MPKALQYVLLGIGVIALLTVLGELAYSVAATTHGNIPVKIVHVQAGPYPLIVNLYTYPAHASYALPFSIAPQQSTNGTLTYDVTSIPDDGDAPATPVRASLRPDANVQNGTQGNAEITVQGTWTLDIIVNGPAGQGQGRIPIVATAPPAIPEWLGWTIGLIPLYGLLLFLLLQRGHKRKSAVTQTTVMV